MSSKLLQDAGQALYGPRWQSDLAHDLSVADRTIRRWAAGTADLPPGVALDLLMICGNRARALDDLRRRLEIAAASDR